MKHTVLLILLTVLLCGCGGQSGETVPPETTVEQIQIGEEGELKTLEMVLADGEVLELSVMGKQDINTGRYGVRKILVYRDGQLSQTLDMVTAIEADGVSGIDFGYTESVTLEDAVKLKDVNFDGNPDLEICGWYPNNAIPYYYWIWDPVSGQFAYAFLLQLREVDAENQQLIAWYKVENGLYYTDYYRVSDQKELVLLKREVEDVRPK